MLSIAEHNVCAPFSGWFKQGQREQICRDGNDHVFLMGGFCKICKVGDFPSCRWILQQQTEPFFFEQVFCFSGYDLYAKRFCAGFRHCDCLRMAIIAD